LTNANRSTNIHTNNYSSIEREQGVGLTPATHTVIGGVIGKEHLMNVTRINRFKAKEGMAISLHEFLMSIVPLVEQSQGCASCQVLQNQENQNEFVVIEEWGSVSAHQASAKNIPPEKIRAVMPLLASPPNGLYYGEGLPTVASENRE
jgi:quinol monooxygenase YgiN